MAIQDTINKAEETIGLATDTAKTFTTPSGAVVDALGNLLTPPPVTTGELPTALELDPTQPTAPKFVAELPETIPDTTVSAIMKAPASQFELEQRITEAEQERVAQEQVQLEAQRKAVALATPGTEEFAASESLRNLTQQARIANERALATGDTLGFASGEAGRVNRDNALTLLAASENLKALTGVREAELTAAQLQLGVEDTRLDRLLGIEDTMRGLAVEQRELARNTLGTILDLTSGFEFEETDLETQQSLMNTAISVGLPLDAIKKAMRNAKIAKDEDRALLLSKLSSGSGLTSQDIFKIETDLRKEFNLLPSTKSFSTITDAFTTINSAFNEAIRQEGLGGSKAASDTVLIVAFNKMIDPDSVVRESEFARSTQGQSLINRFSGKTEGLLRGGVGLTDEDRKTIVDMTEKLYDSYLEGINSTVRSYRAIGAQTGFGLNLDNIATEFEKPIIERQKTVDEETPETSVEDIRTRLETLRAGGKTDIGTAEQIKAEFESIQPSLLERTATGVFEFFK